MRSRLLDIAHVRSGDKGDSVNIGLIAKNAEEYPVLVREVTVERVKEHFSGICKGGVERYTLTCEQNGTVKAKKKVLIDRGQVKKLNLRKACR